MCVAHRSKANMNIGMHVAWSTKQEKKSLKTEKLFADITYYKLRAGKHFGYYIIGLGDECNGVGRTEEILNQAFIIPRVHRG